MVASAIGAAFASAGPSGVRSADALFRIATAALVTAAASKARRWTCEMRIPLKSLSSAEPKTGTQWRLNFFRCDQANKAFLAWSPALTGSFHTPEKFGVLEFVE